MKSPVVKCFQKKIGISYPAYCWQQQKIDGAAKALITTWRKRRDVVGLITFASFLDDLRAVLVNFGDMAAVIDRRTCWFLMTVAM